MRISDWSSDVCSSDLPAPAPALAPAPAPAKSNGSAAGTLAGVGPLEAAASGSIAGEEKAPSPSQRPLPAGIRDSAVKGGLPAGEIGRGACRERVCQYV